jgi:hypothetical protein
MTLKMTLKRTIFGAIAAAISLGAPSYGVAQQQGPQPIYQVTVISRTTKAVNYGHRSDPTKVDFKGTVLMPTSHGEATVESRRGAVLIQARFDHVDAPSRFGPGFLTYVVWAIGPDGRPQNLGELVLNHADKGKLDAATHLQAFALIVTAEPYFSVSQPSDAVVMENVIRPDTMGSIEEVNATYELLPRQSFTYEIGKEPAMGPAVSMNEYESTLAIYEAQNAIQHAKTAGAARYASDKLSIAEALLQRAQAYEKNQSKEIVSTAREATQIAEDARLVALIRADRE